MGNDRILKEEILKAVQKAIEEYHGGGNGRRLLIQLEGLIKEKFDL